MQQGWKEAGPGGEPSLDDILASIKQVIERERGLRPGDDGNQDEAVEPALEEEAADLHDLGTHAVMPDQPPAGSGAAEAVRRSLAALEWLARPQGASEHLPDGLALEELARELLRPMLADWIDAHLPAITERMVQAEIARILSRPA